MLIYSFSFSSNFNFGSGNKLWSKWQEVLYMESQLTGFSLVPEALIGTENNKLDANAFPQVLRPAIQQILQDTQDSEDAFYKSASLVFACDMATEQVALNSFSIEEMARYQQLQKQLAAQSAQISVEKTPAALSNSDPLQATNVAANLSTNLDQSTTAATLDTADPLLARMQMHLGPLPLPIADDNSQVFLPDAVGALINRVVTNYATAGDEELLYWALRKLGNCPMVLPAQYVLPLAERMFKRVSGSAGFLDIGCIKHAISNFMLREQMFRVGGLGLRYVLQYSVPESFKSLFTQPEFVAKFDAHDGQVDYEYVLEHAAVSEAKGALLALRWQDPTRARELLQKYWDKRIKDVDDKISCISMLQINLSLADEPFLTELLQHSRNKHVRNEAKLILQNIVGSEYTKQCAQQFLAHVQYLGPDHKKADKGGLKVDNFAYTDELKALGIIDPEVKTPTASSSKAMLKDLFWGMDLSEILALTGHANEPQLAFKILLQHISHSPIFDGITSLEGILVRKIYLAKDAGAAEAFLQQNSRNEGKDYSFYGTLVQLLAPEKREQYLKSELCFDMGHTVLSHFFPPETAGREIDFNPLQDTWAKQLLDQMCARVDSEPIATFMYLPYSMIDVLKQHVANIQQQYSQLDEQFDKTKSDMEARVGNQKLLSSRYIEQSRQLYKLKNKLTWLEKMLAGLELKQQIDETFKRELPEYYVQDLSSLAASGS